MKNAECKINDKLKACSIYTPPSHSQKVFADASTFRDPLGIELGLLV
ncbi:MAG: hypothetical protein IJS60_03250 [Abditibacteriota bacterium]|nr:hypothetical protein [Abditibacteriota bacterium]